MSQAEKPTIVLVHGAWHDSSSWDATREELTKHSYPSVVVKLPSVGANPPVASHHEDTAAVRKELERVIVSEGKEVVLVMHSYGGIPGSEAVTGLEKAARKEKGGVIHALFIAAFLVPKGNSLMGMFDNQFPPYLHVNPENPETLIVDPAADTFYNDITADVREPWIAKMKPQAYSSFKSPVNSVVWENGLTPCTYLKCDMDQGVYPPLQQSMIDTVSKDGTPWNIEECHSGHSAWLNQVETVTQLIRKCAGEQVA